MLARREIAGLADLAGKRVATGAEGSGTRLTADLILDLAEVEPAERVALGPGGRRWRRCWRGRSTRFFYVVGAPAELFRSDRIDPAAFHLLPLTDPVLAAVYTPAEVAAGTYPFVTEPVKVVAVKAVLVTFDFQPERNAYQAASCRLVADMSHLIADALRRAAGERASEVAAVDVKDIPPGWEVSACVLDGLAPGYAFTCRKPDGTVVEEGLGAAAESEPNRLFLQRVCARMGC